MTKPWPIPKLKLDECYIQFIQIGSFLKKTPQLESYLSFNEKVRVSKYHFEKDKKTFIVTRGILRFLIAKLLNIPPAEVAFKFQENGKPELDHNIGLEFNVSHSGNYALIGISLNKTVGVDIEHIKTDFNVLDIAKTYFYGNEYRELNRLPKSKIHEGFFSLWTKKEAIIKYDGKGLGIPLDSFSVSLEPIGSTTDICPVAWTGKWSEKNKLFCLPSPKGYKAACFVDGSIDKIQVFNSNNLLKYL